MTSAAASAGTIHLTGTASSCRPDVASAGIRNAHRRCHRCCVSTRLSGSHEAWRRPLSRATSGNVPEHWRGRQARLRRRLGHVEDVHAVVSHVDKECERERANEDRQPRGRQGCDLSTRRPRPCWQASQAPPRTDEPRATNDETGANCDDEKANPLEEKANPLEEEANPVDDVVRKAWSAHAMILLHGEDATHPEHRSIQAVCRPASEPAVQGA